MLSLAQIKYIRALQQKKFRMLHGSFVVEGHKIVSELLRSNHTINGIYALEEWLKLNRHQIPAGTRVYAITPKVLSRISGMTAPNQVLAEVSVPSEEFPQHIQISGFSLYLDSIQDPGNLGTIIRTADWFGLDALYCSPNTADAYNPKVIQASMGSFLRVRLVRIGLKELLMRAEPKPAVYGASLDGENLFHTHFQVPALIVIGNESKGLSVETSGLIKHHIMIPRKNGGAESLNASVASAIIMAWHSKD